MCSRHPLLKLMQRPLHSQSLAELTIHSLSAQGAFLNLASIIQSWASKSTIQGSNSLGDLFCRYITREPFCDDQCSITNVAVVSTPEVGGVSWWLETPEENGHDANGSLW